MTIAGKNELAASPKAKATTCPTNPGGFIPKYPAIQTATPAAIRAARNSCFSCSVGTIAPLRRSCATAVEITNSKPAAVESAAAKPPSRHQADNPIRKFRNLRVRQYHDVRIDC